MWAAFVRLHDTDNWPYQHTHLTRLHPLRLHPLRLLCSVLVSFHLKTLMTAAPINVYNSLYSFMPLKAYVDLWMLPFNIMLPDIVYYEETYCICEVRHLKNLYNEVKSRHHALWYGSSVWCRLDLVTNVRLEMCSLMWCFKDEWRAVFLVTESRESRCYWCSLFLSVMIFSVPDHFDYFSSFLRIGILHSHCYIYMRLDAVLGVLWRWTNWFAN